MKVARRGALLALAACLSLLALPLRADSVLVFNEIMYHPSSDPEGLEWVELHNQMAVDLDVSSWVLTGGIEFVFPQGTLVRGRGFVVVAKSPQALRTATGFANAMGPFTGRLDDGGERLELRNNNFRLMDSLRYDDEDDWPVGPDGSGVSLAKIDADSASAPAGNWAVSLKTGGTPGSHNFPQGRGPDRLPPPLALNEISPPSIPGAWLELINHGAEPVSLQGMVLEAPGTGAYTFPAEELPPGGYLTRTEAQLGFPLPAGERIFLLTADRSAVMDAARVHDSRRARHPAGTGAWRVPDRATPGDPNSFSFHEEIVINEIMYHHRLEPEAPAVVEETVLLPLAASWKYEQSGRTDLGSEWREPEFDDGAWPSGPALLYNEGAALPGPKSTPLNLGPMTYYFRAWFEFSGDPSAASLVLRHIIDDGAIVYLNGVEVHRFNMLEGPVGPATPASPGVGDAVLMGPFPLPTSSLVEGANLLAVEVHQGSAASTDIVFGGALSTVVTVSEARPLRESPEAWIELYNRAAVPVDLTGWSLEDGIEYHFEEGTALEPGGYLVVATDRDFLEALHPGLRVAGNFQGRLSGKGERIVLMDSSGNPADEVHYHDGGRWPSYADGGGSSLELRDPRADNSQAEAWAASDEGRKSAWQEFTYRGTAAGGVGPTLWNELVLGLLEEGEVLLDDVVVVESPGGAAVPLVQNPDFEEGTLHWRLLGNHDRSEQVPDPDNASNTVLSLTATGPTEHMHNHLETTLAGGTITDGTEYEISFRARWMAGSNQLNHRLYFNRLPRTTLLAVPEKNGTPGEQNTRYRANIGPTYRDFAHAPVVPTGGAAAAVTVRAEDPDGVSLMTLWWSINGGVWLKATMADQGAGLYHGSIPGQAAGTLVHFYVEGRDLQGAVSTFPAGGRGSRALYRVRDGLAQLTRLHNFRILMTAPDTNLLHLATNVMSDQRLGATVVYDERLAFYDVGVHLKGSERGRPESGRVGFNVRFQPDQLFRGVHRTVHVDRSGGWSLGVPNGQDEILIKHMVNRAGGLPGMYDDLIRVIAPRSAQTGTALLLMGRYEDVFLDSQYPRGGEGTVYKFELIYYPTTTSDGTPEGLKLPQPDLVTGSDLQDLGNDKESYRWTLLIENNRARDDYRRLMDLCKVFNLSGAALEAGAGEVMDVDEWMRAFAIYSLAGVNDAYTQGNNHNLKIYVRPEDGRTLAFPWDMDFAFTRPISAPLWGDQNLSRVISLPPYRRLFYCHLNDLISKVCNTSYMSYWSSHYGGLAGQNYSSILSYLGQRSAYVLQNLPAGVEFRITTNGGEPFVTPQPAIRLEGEAWIDVKTVLVSGVDLPLELAWTSTTHWQATVELRSGSNDLTLLAFDLDGKLVGMDEISVTSSADPQFIRGDANLDGGVDLSDALRVLLHLFAGAPLACQDAGDASGDETIDIADAIHLLHFLFMNGLPPPAPFPRRGLDPAPAGALGCAQGI